MQRIKPVLLVVSVFIVYAFLLMGRYDPPSKLLLPVAATVVTVFVVKRLAKRFNL